jgi:hypothetical protein
LGAKGFAHQIFNRELDRHPQVFFALFFSRAWTQPELPTGLWEEVLAAKGLR